MRRCNVSSTTECNRMYTTQHSKTQQNNTTKQNKTKQILFPQARLDKKGSYKLTKSLAYEQKCHKSNQIQ